MDRARDGNGRLTHRVGRPDLTPGAVCLKQEPLGRDAGRYPQVLLRLERAAVEADVQLEREDKVVSCKPANVKRTSVTPSGRKVAKD